MSYSISQFRVAEAMLCEHWPECPADMVERMIDDLAIGCAQVREPGDLLPEEHVRQFRQHWETRWPVNG
jgi:hypothetical protein